MASDCSRPTQVYEVSQLAEVFRKAMMHAKTHRNDDRHALQDLNGLRAVSVLAREAFERESSALQVQTESASGCTDARERGT